MSTFTGFSNEESIRYDKETSKKLNGAYWRNLESFRYYLHYKNSNTYVDVPAGILSDGASSPRLTWPIIPPWGAYAQAVLLHDRLCEYPFVTVFKYGRESKEMINRKEVDRIFYEALRVLGIKRWEYYAIRIPVDFYRIVLRSKVGREINPVKRQLEMNFTQEVKMALYSFGATPSEMTAGY